MRIELTAFCLRSKCSTTKLHQPSTCAGSTRTVIHFQFWTRKFSSLLTIYDALQHFSFSPSRYFSMRVYAILRKTKTEKDKNARWWCTKGTEDGFDSFAYVWKIIEKYSNSYLALWFASKVEDINHAFLVQYTDNFFPRGRHAIVVFCILKYY